MLRCLGKHRAITIEGHDVIQIPVIRPIPIGPLTGLDEILKGVNYVVVMSEIAASYASRALRGFKGRVVCIGPGTKGKLEEEGLECELPLKYSSRGIIEYFKGLERGVVAVLRSRRGSPVLKEGLEREGFRVIEVPLYDLEPYPDGVKAACHMAEYADYVVFTSRLTVYAASRCLDRIGKRCVIAIGEETEGALSEFGLKPLTPDKPTIGSIVMLLKSLLKS